MKPARVKVAGFFFSKSLECKVWLLSE